MMMIMGDDSKICLRLPRVRSAFKGHQTASEGCCPSRPEPAWQVGAVPTFRFSPLSLFPFQLGFSRARRDAYTRPVIGFITVFSISQ